jgi:GT2 family glycosyltransferase
METPNISVVIPSYNGQGLLEQILNPLIKAIEYYRGDSEIIIVDDASFDASEQFLKDKFPGTILIKNNTNQGFGKSCNRGFRVCKNDLVILLNNDVFVDEDFIAPLVTHFNDPLTFAVRPGLKPGHNEESEDLKHPRIGAVFKYGFCQVPKEITNPGKFAFFAGGGAAMFNKGKFLSLGGFDELYYPFYFEDVDLSYRAWKRGWRVNYEPKSIIYHQSGMTIKRFYGPWRINLIHERNSYFFVWKNITDIKLNLKHLFFLPLRVIRSLLMFNIVPFLAFFWAIISITAVFKKRRSEELNCIVSDREIFAIFN